MMNCKYIFLPISFLEANNVSKESFMEDSSESKLLLSSIFKNLPPYLELKNIFLVQQNFILTLTNKENFVFDNKENFSNFISFIAKTNFINKIKIDSEKKEISIDKDISPYFYDLMYEFLI